MKGRLQWNYSTVLTWSLMNLIFASTWFLVVSTILISFSSPLSLKTCMITQQSLFVSKLCYHICLNTLYQWVNHAPHISRSIHWKLVVWIYWSIEIYMSGMNVHIHGAVKLSSHVLNIFLLHICTSQSLMFHSMKITYGSNSAVVPHISNVTSSEICVRIKIKNTLFTFTFLHWFCHKNQ